MSIILPNFTCNAILCDNSTIIQQELILTDYLKANHCGLIIYFYPKDNTSGCSLQAENFSQYQPEFAKLGYHIIGVSRDSAKSHERFITNKSLNFTLISDSDEKLCQHFCVIGEKKLYGKVSLGVVRSTFVFDKNGNLQHELRNVRAKGHVESVLQLLSNPTNIQ